MIIMLKPMLASDANLDNTKFPCIIQPKVDGVRGLNLDGMLTGRSLKQHKNHNTNRLFSTHYLKGFDGELIVGTDPTHPDLCRLTSSAVGSYEGCLHITWYIFDYITAETIKLPYWERLEYTKSQIKLTKSLCPEMVVHLELIESHTVYNIDELLEWEQKWLEMGYEGLIIRDPEGKYKQGRSTAKEGGLNRVKRFKDAEAVVIYIIEGEENNNEKQTNELGNSFRSSHKENKSPNGMVGSLTCRISNNIFDDVTKELLFEEGLMITVSPGKMTHNERMYYFGHKEELLNKTIKFKSFTKGVKDKPRFPTFISIRNPEDL